MLFDHSYAKQLADLVSRVKVSPFASPKLESVNHSLLSQLGIAKAQFAAPQLLENLFSETAPFNRHAVAQKYGGHQFGVWNPELGDGRGLLLGEVVDNQQRRWDLHLKGAGKTPYSRFGDGRAVLRSTIREYLASEALHHLGIPSSRALCLISSDETVYRETPENGAMMIRACQSHIRFGHFEYFYHSKQSDKLQRLLDYTLETHFSHCLQSANPYLALLTEICLSTADLIAKWQAFGFCHGVMNTDNMSIHGITFDYGPYAFLDNYEPGYVCNHSDHSGRYAFDQQPGVALWNLNALAHAFSPFLTIEQIKAALQQYEPRLQRQYAQLMSHKLGFEQPDGQIMELMNQWLNMLASDKRDYTQSFRLLCHSDQHLEPVVDHFIDRKAAHAWVLRYQSMLNEKQPQVELRQQRMLAVNPKFILRNYLAQQAIDKAQSGSFDYFHRLLDVLAKPFDEQLHNHEFAAPPPDWGLAMEISCSS